MVYHCEQCPRYFNHFQTLKNHIVGFHKSDEMDIKEADQYVFTNNSDNESTADESSDSHDSKRKSDFDRKTKKLKFESSSNDDEDDNESNDSNESESDDSTTSDTTNPDCFWLELRRSEPFQQHKRSVFTNIQLNSLMYIFQNDKSQDFAELLKAVGVIKNVHALMTMSDKGWGFLEKCVKAAKYKFFKLTLEKLVDLAVIGNLEEDVFTTNRRHERFHNLSIPRWNLQQNPF